MIASMQHKSLCRVIKWQINQFQISVVLSFYYRWVVFVNEQLDVGVV
jgi:hypothetical protein